MKSPPTLRRSFILSSMLVSLIPLLCIGIFILFFIIKEKKSAFMERTDLLAQGIRGQIQIFMDQPLSALQVISVMLEDFQAYDSWRQSDILNAYVQSSPYFELINLLDYSGRVVDVGLSRSREKERMDLLRNDLFHLPEFQRALSEGKPLWSDTFLSLASNQLSVMLYMPAGENVLAAEIRLVTLSRFIRKLCPVNVQTMVIDTNGTVMVHSDPELRISGMMVNDIFLVTSALNGEEKMGLFHYRGKTFFGATSIIEPIGWVSLIAVPLDSFWSTLTVPLFILCCGIVIAMGFSLLLAIHRSQKLSSPLRDITAKSKVIARGDYSYLSPPEEYLELTHLAMCFNDMVSAIQQREERLRENELKYRELVENTSNLVLRLDKDLRISYANHTLDMVTAIPPKQARGTEFARSIFPEDWPAFASTLAEWIASQVASGTHECRLQDRNGEIHVFLMACNLHYDGAGGLIDINIIGHDMTLWHQIEEERRELEEKKQRSQKMELLGLMAGGVAHDLNNILAGIINVPEILLLSLAEKDPMRKSLELIKHSGERAAAVVADLLTIARGSAAARTSLDLNRLIESYVTTPEFHRLQTIHPYVEFSFTAERPLGICCCSKTHIEKVLMNLLINAFEAIKKEGRVEVVTENVSVTQLSSLACDLPSARYVSFCVSDTGSGIAADDLQRIFEPFFSKKGLGRSGTGIGLSVVWNSIREHGGTVVVDSSPDGTCFRVLLPVSEGEANLSEHVDEIEKLKGDGEQILLVDDEEVIREVAANMLKILGYKATTVSSGEMALRYLKEHDVDLVILDMQMDPGINGQQTYAAIHARKPRQRALIATGFSCSTDVDKAMAQGVGGLIQKPYNLQNLGRAIHEELNRGERV